MPELPEVETIACGLAKRVSGDMIDSVWIGSRSQPLKSPASTLASTLEGKRIVRVHRAGKHIVFDLAAPTRSLAKQRSSGSGKTRQAASQPLAREPDAQWVVHFGMTGRLVVSRPDVEIAKHTHLIAKLASGCELRFIDPRMFGRISVHASAFDPGGVEPLEVGEEQFYSLFHGRKTPIKSALLNQKLLRGVGNIYADESLFRAGIRPRRRAATITREQFRRLHRAVQEVLREAFAAGGSSSSDFVGANGEDGFFELEHRVYGREGEPCLICRTKIKRVVLGGRSSHYCPHCQK